MPTYTLVFGKLIDLECLKWHQIIVLKWYTIALYSCIQNIYFLLQWILLKSVQFEKKNDEIFFVLYLQKDSVICQQQIAERSYKRWHITNMTIYYSPLV